MLCEVLLGAPACRCCCCVTRVWWGSSATPKPLLRSFLASDLHFDCLLVNTPPSPHEHKLVFRKQHQSLFIQPTTTAAASYSCNACVDTAWRVNSYPGSKHQTFQSACSTPLSALEGLQLSLDQLSATGKGKRYFCCCCSLTLLLLPLMHMSGL